MADQLLIRDVPHEIRSWIDEERHTKRMTQKEFVHTLLHNAYEETQKKNNQPEQISLDLFPSESPSEPTAYRFKFVDLFAGVGVFRLGLQKAGGAF